MVTVLDDGDVGRLADMAELVEVVTGGYDRGADDATLYLSTGLAGTEVVVARHLLARHRAT